MTHEELEEILDTIPRSATPYEAIHHYLVAWVIAISTAAIESGVVPTAEEAQAIVITFKQDSVEITEALIMRKLNELRNASNN